MLLVCGHYDLTELPNNVPQYYRVMKRASPVLWYFSVLHWVVNNAVITFGYPEHPARQTLEQKGPPYCFLYISSL